MGFQYTKVPTLVDSLSNQIEGIRQTIQTNTEILALLLLGSCSRGSATYRSDIDLLVVVEVQKLTYGKVVSIRDQIESQFSSQGRESLLSSPLPIQITVVSKSVFNTEEPAMKEALLHGIALLDPSEFLKDYLEAA